MGSNSLAADLVSIHSELLTSMTVDTFGHSFYVSVMPSAKPDALGFYCLADLLVHDPDLLPPENLAKGMGVFEYLENVLRDIKILKRIYIALDFLTNPSTPGVQAVPVPIPSCSFVLTAPEGGSVAAPSTLPSVLMIRPAAAVAAKSNKRSFGCG